MVRWGMEKREQETATEKLIQKIAFINDYKKRGLSPYRAREAADFILAGFAAFYVVDSMTPYRGRGENPASIDEDERCNYYIVCRPSSSGKWGKSVVIRAIRVVNAPETMLQDTK